MHDPVVERADWLQRTRADEDSRSLWTDFSCRLRVKMKAETTRPPVVRSSRLAAPMVTMRMPARVAPKILTQYHKVHAALLMRPYDAVLDVVRFRSMDSSAMTMIAPAVMIQGIAVRLVFSARMPPSVGIPTMPSVAALT